MLHEHFGIFGRVKREPDELRSRGPAYSVGEDGEDLGAVAYIRIRG